MLTAECYKQRMERGLSFLEFNYMIMQSYDFYYLFKKYNCNLEFGGDDQWSNMLGGTELIRKKLAKDAEAMTINLLLKSDGTKMGKTAGGAVWLDKNKTSPFEFYQYWRNVDDSDVLKCIKMLTFISLDEIAKMESWKGEELNKAKEILAYELTTMVHGKEEADKAKEAAMALFSGSASLDNVPVAELSKEEINEGINVMDLVVKTNFITSKSEARRLIQQGGLCLNDEKVTDFNYIVKSDDLVEDYVLIKKGKKNFLKIIFN